MSVWKGILVPLDLFAEDGDDIESTRRAVGEIAAYSVVICHLTDGVLLWYRDCTGRVACLGCPAVFYFYEQIGLLLIAYDVDLTEAISEVSL